ncbi:MAG: N-formylglutamate amidohydrolase, partial [Gemmatimonadales bacterium]|nr:N-formylglutamate amidohydrolase [Gemmatimonadales bacterium]
MSFRASLTRGYVLAAALLAACGTAGPEAPAPYTAGTSYFSVDGYVEYIAGDLPLLITVPHGGTMQPLSLPDRTTGVFASDLNTQDLARRIASAIRRATGGYPHVVICLLHRTKLDCNRDLPEAADDPAAREAWSAFHRLAETAREQIAQRTLTGFAIDLHGHGHPIQRVELGYLLSAATLGLSDAALQQGGHAAATSVRDLAARSPGGLSGLLRG